MCSSNTELFKGLSHLLFCTYFVHSISWALIEICGGRRVDSRSQGIKKPPKGEPQSGSTEDNLGSLTTWVWGVPMPKAGRFGAWPWRGSEAPSLEAPDLVGDLMMVGGGRLAVLLEMTKLSHGSSIDLFTNWLAQLWAFNLRKSFHPLLNTGCISLFVLQGCTQYTGETWIYTTIDMPLMTFLMPLTLYMCCFPAGSKPVREFRAHWPLSDTRADPHAGAQPPPPSRDFFSEAVSLWRPQFLCTYSFYLVDNTLFGNVPSCNYKSC